MKREVKNLRKGELIHVNMNLRGMLADLTKKHNLTDEAKQELTLDILVGREEVMVARAEHEILKEAIMPTTEK